jgi:RNA-directed DNA polymerase
MARTTKQDSVRDLQRTLYRAAKADPGRRFHALYDKVFRRDVLERAWELVRAKKGAAGIDRQTIADVEAYGIAKLLDGLAADLKDGSYRYRLGVSWRGHDLTGLGAPDGQRRFGYLAV